MEGARLTMFQVQMEQFKGWRANTRESTA